MRPASRNILAISIVGASELLSGKDIAPEDLEFFETEIRPALIAHCYECHSEEEGKRKGGLWLDRRSGWEVGGDTGPAAIPHDLDSSLLLETIRYDDPDLEMPPDGKMPAETIAAFEEWVQRGLPDPRTGESQPAEEGIDLEKGREFWSFQPRRTDFGEKKEIDNFIDAALSEKGIDAAGPADPEARLRRAKVDLTGLIPTVAEQDEFLAEPTPEKWKEMIDRWLASDAFGERWGRHWLDIVRYADSSGGGRAMPFYDAWRFRDFVIDSFREDKPLDQLVTQHVAGDLLPYGDLQERQENLVGTGFLVLGPINYENQNKAELELEIVDEQLDTLGRAFLGQTIGCARCHDHKFDPIPTADYYSLAGIFLSTDFVTHANVSKWHTEPVPPTPEAKQAIAEYRASLSKAEKAVSELKKRIEGMGGSADSRKGGVEPEILRGIVVDDTQATLTGEWEESTHSGRWVGAGYIHDRNEKHIAKSVRFEASIPTAGEYELRMSFSTGPNRNTHVPVKIETRKKAVDVTVNEKLEPELDELFQSLGKFQLEAGEIAAVTISNQTKTDGHVIVDAIQWLPLFEMDDSTVMPDQSLLSKLQKELSDAEKHLKTVKKGAPEIPEAMSVVDHDVDKISDTEIRIRGVESSRGEIAPRGFLQVASWDERGIPDDSSGRLELAEWLVDPQNPLTARVLANRIWLKLMGEGLVRSPDNFGVTGQAPTHPELLDFLAERLIDSGWSTKALVREIMLSSVYSRSSEGEVVASDPENLLYHRAHRRTLDAETLRDAILTLAGTMDRQAGGPSLPKGFRTEFGYEFTTLRRSVYVPVFRNSGYELFNTFDFANPNFTIGKRSRSSIPTQALFLTNSEFIHQHAAEAASELLQLPAASDSERVELAFRRTVGRFPKEEELVVATDFLKESGEPADSDDADAWTALQRVLFASIDFRFLH